MINNRQILCFFGLFACLYSAASADPVAALHTGPKDGTVLLIRHAEKPDEGDGITPAGEARATAYIHYFTNLKLESEALKPDEIFASADSHNSRRPRLTVEPLARALKIPVNLSYKDKDFLSLVTALQSGHNGKHILICWHHGAVPEMLRAFGADPGTVLPGGQWPKDEYGWLIVLRYDQEGHLKEAQRIVEGL